VPALSFPNNVQIETTSHCNARCGFCPHPETSRTEPQGVMDDALFASIVEQLAPHRLALVQPFLNNDPLTDPRILERLRLLRERLPQVPLALTTNGLRLTAEVARALAQLDLATVHVSSHGLTPGTYRETMGIDAWTVLRNVNLLADELRRRRSATRLVVSAVLLRANRGELAHMYRYWRSRGIEFYLNPLNDRAGNLPGGTFRELLPLESAARGEHLRRYDMSGCPALDAFMGILWNGDVISCCMDWRRARVLGNARESALSAIWSGTPYARLRALSEQGRLAEEPLCRSCGDNRFGVAEDALRTLDRRPPGDRDRAVLELLANLDRDEGVLQLGLVRKEP
jgi:MoaA/NifB/PqqE/SkfB family radical SAM enzyme